MEGSSLDSKRKINKRNYWIMIVLGLLVLVIGLSIAGLADTAGGKIKVQRIYFNDEVTGDLLHARLYTPPNATFETPAPAVLFMMGSDSDSERYSAYSIELARRGYIVLNLDLRGEGLSDGLPANHMDTAKGNWNYDTVGAMSATNYLRMLDYVDKDNIVISGHSRGAVQALLAVKNCAIAGDQWYKAAFYVGLSTAYAKVYIPQDDPFTINYAILAGVDDDSLTNTKALIPAFGVKAVDEIVPGKILGSIEDGTARAFYKVRSVHNAEFINLSSIAYTVDFIQKVTDAPNEINPKNLIYLWRFVGTTLGLIAFIFLIFPIGGLLLMLPFYKSINEETPPYKGLTGKKWWIGAVLTAIVGPLIYYKATDWGDKILSSRLFPYQRTTATLGWALFVALITLALMFVNYLITKKPNRLKAVNYGLTDDNNRINFRKIGKSFLLAGTIVLILYLLIMFEFFYTGIDVREVNTSFRVLIPDRVGWFFVYLIPFILAFLVITSNLHGLIRYKSGEISILKEIFINMLVLSPWYWLWYLKFGAAPWNDVVAKIGPMYAFVWTVPVQLAIVSSVSTYFYRKTGRVYTGAFLAAMMITWTCVGSLVVSAAGIPGW